MSDQRYKVLDESQSGHCCFDFTVVDTHTPHPYYSHPYYSHLFYAVCECFEKDQAEQVAAALNAAEAAKS